MLREGIVTYISNELFATSKLSYTIDNSIYRDINIYELAHKCKEWLVDNRQFVQIDMYGKYMTKCIIYCNITKDENCFIGETEPEAIFQACEFILNEINKA